MTVQEREEAVEGAWRLDLMMANEEILALVYRFTVGLDLVQRPPQAKPCL